MIDVSAIVIMQLIGAHKNKAFKRISAATGYDKAQAFARINAASTY